MFLRGAALAPERQPLGERQPATHLERSASARPARPAPDPGCRRRAAGARRWRCARSAASPPSIDARIRLKSVVPPPTSQTSTSAPSVSMRRGVAAMRGDPRVERRQRLLEQHDRGESRGPRRLHGQLARLLVERRRHGEDDRLLARAAARRLPRRSLVIPRVAQVREERAERLDRRQPRPVLDSPRQDRRRAVDRRVGRATTWPTRSAAPAPARPGRAQDAGDGLRRRRPTAGASCRACRSASVGR